MYSIHAHSHVRTYVRMRAHTHTHNHRQPHKKVYVTSRVMHDKANVQIVTVQKAGGLITVPTTICPTTVFSTALCSVPYLHHTHLQTDRDK